MFDVQLHAYLRALIGSRARQVGPFLAAVDDHDASLFRNYAVPDDGAEPTPDEIETLTAFFTDRGRTPRLEYLPGPFPRLEVALLGSGFRPERRLPVMTCRPTDAAASPAEKPIEVILATSDEQLRQVAEAQNDAYGQAETTDHDVDRLRSTLEGGGLVALAVDRSSGYGVGGGLCAPPHGGISELAAVGVRADYRRRGIAAALTGLLTNACPAAGITTPFLMAAGDAEEDIYRRVGYHRVTEMLHISR